MTASDTKEAEQVFKALDAFDQLTFSHIEKPTRVGFAELYKYATNPAHVASDTLIKALSSNLTIRRDLKRIIAKQAIVHLPKAAAASTGGITEREADGFTLSLKPSNADPEQVYLIIESVDRDESPTLLFIESDDSTILRLPIEDFQDGEAQILLSEQDDIVKALRNPGSEVILR